MPSQVFSKYYCCTIEKVLTGCFATWYGNCSFHNCKALKWVVKTAQYITGTMLPPIQDTRGKPAVPSRTLETPARAVLSPLPSGRWYQSMRSDTNRVRESFYLQAIKLLNT
jgi:hypothetical protein